MGKIKLFKKCQVNFTGENKYCSLLRLGGYAISRNIDQLEQ